MENQLPSIPPPDLDKIILCLNLFQSDRDHEVLGAVRGVNRIMDRLDLTWNKVFAEIIERTKQELRSEKPAEPTIDDALVVKIRRTSPGEMAENRALNREVRVPSV
jgi:hypothetical protein